MRGGTEAVKEIKLWPNGAPQARGTSDEDCPALTPFLLDEGDSPAVIVCPGGGYARRAEHEGEPVAEWLNSIGLSAFVLRYRVAPYRYPCALLDLQRAIRTVRSRSSELGIDRERVAALGFSAGGHLAASAGTAFKTEPTKAVDLIDNEDARPDLLLLCYPVISMDKAIVHRGSRLNLIGEGASAMLADDVSIEKRVTGDTPPTFIWHTSDDEGVPVEHSLLLAAALKKSTAFPLSFTFIRRADTD